MDCTSCILGWDVVIYWSCVHHLRAARPARPGSGAAARARAARAPPATGRRRAPTAPARRPPPRASPLPTLHHYTLHFWCHTGLRPPFPKIWASDFAKYDCVTGSNFPPSICPWVRWDCIHSMTEISVGRILHVEWYRITGTSKENRCVHSAPARCKRRDLRHDLFGPQTVHPPPVRSNLRLVFLNISDI